VKNGLNRGQLREFGKVFGELGFGGEVQRRGVHVNTPKIGSRVGQMCFGGILEIHAVLRRDLFWGNLFWGFLGVLLGVPRSATEEGGHLVCFWEI
jgi:hypothetical protein